MNTAGFPGKKSRKMKPATIQMADFPSCLDQFQPSLATIGAAPSICDDFTPRNLPSCHWPTVQYLFEIWFSKLKNQKVSLFPKRNTAFCQVVGRKLYFY